MRLFIVPILAALAGVPTLSPSLPAVEGESPPKTVGEGDRSVAPGADQSGRTEAQRQREEAQRRTKAGEPAAERDLHVTPPNELSRPEDNKPLNEPGKPKPKTGDDDQANRGDPEVLEAQIQKQIIRLKAERPELFRRLDVDGNGELATEELRRHRDLFTQRQKAQQKLGENQGPGGATRPAQIKGAARTMPAAAATDEDVANFLFSE